MPYLPHKVLQCIKVKCDTACSIRWGWTYSFGGSNLIYNTDEVQANQWKLCTSYATVSSYDATNSTATSGTSFRMYCDGSSSTVKNWQFDLNYFLFIDITDIYGPGNEPNTLADFEADYFKWFGKPFEYTTYDCTMINSKIINFKTIGFNQWDEEWELGQLNGSNGNNTNNNSANYIRTKNYISVLPSTAYYYNISALKKIAIDGSHSITVCYYDANKQFISGYTTYTNWSDNNWKQITPAKTAYVRFALNNYGSIYKNDICMNISNDSLNGTYQAYEERTYSIPITSITGKLNGTGNSVVVFPDGMKSAGSYYDEIKIENGVTKAIKRVGSVQLNQIDWNHDGQDYIYSGSKQYCNLANKTTCLYTWNNSIRNRYHTFSQSGAGYLEIYGPGLNNANTKTLVGNVVMNYKLPTEEVYVLDNFSLPINIKVWKSGVEMFESSTSESITPKLDIHYNSN